MIFNVIGLLLIMLSSVFVNYSEGYGALLFGIGCVMCMMETV